MSFIDDYEANMNAFTFREHQNFLTYLYTLTQKGLTIDDAIKYVEQKNRVFSERRRRNRAKEPIIGKCICGAAMLLLPVNTVPANRIDGDYKSVWVCQNKLCMETLYNTYSIDDEFLKVAK